MEQNRKRMQKKNRIETKLVPAITTAVAVFTTTSGVRPVMYRHGLQDQDL